MVISGLAIASCFGIGAERFFAGWQAGQPAFTRDPDGLAPRAGLVPGVDADDDFAATKQVELKERSSALAVGTVAKLLASHDLDALPAHRRGIVLGSALASIDSFMTVTRASLAGAKPYFVDHRRVPASTMNYTSSQVAIRFAVHGPNVTVTAGRATGLTALIYGRRLIAAGRADALVCGAFEAVSSRRLLIEEAAGRLSLVTPPGEGCCVFLLETAESAGRAGRPILAELPAITAGVFAEPDQAREALAGLMTRALQRAGASAADVHAVVRGTPGEGFFAEQEANVVNALLPGVAVIDPAALVGDTYGASAAFGVAAAIANAAHDGQPAGVSLVTSIDQDGQVACGVVRPTGRWPGHR